ncbi:MAG: GTPase HflX [Acetobacter sp.]|nr:GTPase HflX [Bacteroides sp.]MCM1341280.1 GTPase HflX [Acetobacter sp.]MCM1433944.1 GTPase HflX [Clostridiales bacterium]
MNFDLINEEKAEQALLISVDTGEFDADISIKELEELAKTAGAEIAGIMIQKRPVIEGATYVGKGRLSEISEFCNNNDIDIIIADGELSPVQVRNIENATDTRVVDRTTLILDIFAGRAQSKEGKLQVELAQLKYSLPRLTGKGTSLSRLGGGIGTRGPGETKLETDKRHIRRKIQYIKEELDAVEKRRNMQHRRRKKNGVMVAAIVGYTNAGKSTLMNRLTDAGVLQEDKLFATLDPTARKLVLPDGQQIMIVDTVGFISRLPHQLVDAFRSTLEEATYADVILNVCDASDDECHNHIRITNEILNSLFSEVGIPVPMINVFNKCDKINPDNDPALYSADTSVYVNPCVRISAKTGEGIDDLLIAVQRVLPQTRKRVKLLLPFDKGSAAAKIRTEGVVHSEEYIPEGLLIDATAEISYLDTIKDYIIE